MVSIIFFLSVTTLYVTAKKATINSEINIIGSAEWVKLTKEPACFEGKGRSPGSFKSEFEVLAHQFKFVYRSGGISCQKDKRKLPFGCAALGPSLGVFLTDDGNRPIVPPQPIQRKHEYTPLGWYQLNGFRGSLTTVTISTGQNPYHVRKGQELRVWYGEDLYSHNEKDNTGRTCADVYALV